MLSRSVSLADAAGSDDADPVSLDSRSVADVTGGNDCAESDVVEEEGLSLPQAARLNTIASPNHNAVNFFMLIFLSFIALPEDFQDLFMGHLFIATLGNTAGIGNFFQLSFFGPQLL